MRNIHRKTLASLGVIEFVDAENGAEGLTALQAAGSQPFDLVLVDWNMPVMNGLAFVLKARETDKRTPMVMVTTESEKTRVMDAIRAGISGYVVKPFNEESMLEKVRAALGRGKAAA
jgi:two-component system chemotaxis response regulator CheY